MLFLFIYMIIILSLVSVYNITTYVNNIFLQKKSLRKNIPMFVKHIKL